MIAEYWILKKQKVNVPELYRPHGMYRYWNGINWRALLALCIGFVPVLPGFATSLICNDHMAYRSAGLIQAVNNSIPVSEGAQHLFALSYLYSFLSAMLVYVVASKIWPARESYPEKNVHSDDVGYAAGDRPRQYSHA